MMPWLRLTIALTCVVCGSELALHIGSHWTLGQAVLDAPPGKPPSVCYFSRDQKSVTLLGLENGRLHTQALPDGYVRHFEFPGRELLLLCVRPSPQPDHFDCSIVNLRGEARSKSFREDRVHTDLLKNAWRRVGDQEFAAVANARHVRNDSQTLYWFIKDGKVHRGEVSIDSSAGDFVGELTALGFRWAYDPNRHLLVIDAIWDPVRTNAMRGKPGVVRGLVAVDVTLDRGESKFRQRWLREFPQSFASKFAVNGSLFASEGGGLIAERLSLDDGSIEEVYRWWERDADLENYFLAMQIAEEIWRGRHSLITNLGTNDAPVSWMRFRGEQSYQRNAPALAYLDGHGLSRIRDVMFMTDLNDGQQHWRYEAPVSRYNFDPLVGILPSRKIVLEDDRFGKTVMLLDWDTGLVDRQLQPFRNAVFALIGVVLVAAMLLLWMIFENSPVSNADFASVSLLLLGIVGVPLGFALSSESVFVIRNFITLIPESILVALAIPSTVNFFLGDQRLGRRIFPLICVAGVLAAWSRLTRGGLPEVFWGALLPMILGTGLLAMPLGVLSWFGIRMHRGNPDDPLAARRLDWSLRDLVILVAVSAVLLAISRDHISAPMTVDEFRMISWQHFLWPLCALVYLIAAGRCGWPLRCILWIGWMVPLGYVIHVGYARFAAEGHVRYMDADDYAIVSLLVTALAACLAGGLQRRLGFRFQRTVIAPET
ncbi:MAG: hypothetical protein AAF958_00125 [Planctomycetota bacterium]